MPDFLLEIQTEELPAGYVGSALAALEESFRGSLTENRLEVGSIRTTSTPRRLVLWAEGLPDSQPPFVEEVRGPAKRIAFDQVGQPTKAAIGFARAQGVNLEDLVVRRVKGTDYLFAVREVPGEPTGRVLARILPGLIARLPWPKSMRWRGRSFSFARPIRGLLALLDAEVVPIEVAGVKADRSTPGHPFLAPQRVELAQADYHDYRDRLRSAFVMVERTERRSAIEKALLEIYGRHGCNRIPYPHLLEEVTDLVEWPLVLEGRFDPAFLDLPEPVLIAAMTSHQRYFPIHREDGHLVASFAVVANRHSDPAGTILRGNERVLAGRLADARFFFDEDRKRPLASRLPELAHILFQEDLGNYLERTERIKAMGEDLCRVLMVDDPTRRRVLRAAELSKADLLTEMVGEFPELQGVMGRVYALADGEDPEVAEAIAEHYLPRHATDQLPRTLVGCLVSLADKIDTVVGCFAAGLAPTGSQDPYALRRRMQGIVRIIVSRGFRLSLRSLFEAARTRLPAHLAEDPTLIQRVMDFLGDRLYHQALDEGYPHNLVRAVLAAGFDDPTDFFSRLSALRRLMEEPLWPGLVELVERTYKITRQAHLPPEVEPSLLRESAERDLFQRYLDRRDEIQQLVDAGDYLAASRAYYHAFAQPVHRFFEEVFVNVEDQALRANRLLLCKLIHRLYAERIADLALLPGT